MKIAYVGIHKFITRNERLYFICERTKDAAVQAEWADDVLKRTNVQFDNGRWSHEAAGEILEKAEDVLSNYLVVTA
ncbi:hypothetical protein BZF66_05710 [Salmonella enterica]|uniref:hypothetical protein n=1 Tax=Salmonella enterica TaxID=28901 RepID=UPI000FDF70B5|nr:hypothetical protein CPT_Munch_525 [Salmonella phage Munch]EAR2661135.1 hypothetical protein [Salmonella enterica]ECV9083922.1 hypothetical protein [Salmonella enterica subsp. enterica serovar Infantis]MCP0435477.1 hypothetical protein [Salmonella enterica subsp. enterica serovar Mbandaka]EAZ2022788.1 hypothetical protein [Salmonella enterica]